MLEDLDQVDWANLRSMYGSSTEIPTWIRNQTSHDLELRKYSRNKLSEYLNHQDSIAEVTQVAIPFLVELLMYEEVDKPQIVALLIDIVRSYYLTFDIFLEVKRPNTFIFNYPSQLYMYLNTLKEITKGEDVYRKLLKQGDTILKIVIVQLLAILGDFAPEWAIDEVSISAKQTYDIGLRAEAIWAIGLIVSSSYRINQQKLYPPEKTLTFLNNEYDPLVQLAAVSAYLINNPVDLILSKQVILEYLNAFCTIYLDQKLYTKSTYLLWYHANQVTGFDEIPPWAFASRSAITRTISRVRVPEDKLKSVLDRLPASKNELEKLIIES
jgi:hypothetical protein